ncbi:MAG: hypothetical protein K0S53_2330 [Bacteroidetes bacterium]|jgi:hypothetical protein|nr:hypothetical protein [Bacteroidota bacterium]MDF2450579.1 hypothetical protein [Bacteroidota bacterium]
METTIRSNQTRSTNRTSQATSTTTTAFWDKMEFNRFGIISILVVFIGCIGGIAAAYGAQDNALKIALIAFPTIISLALVLAVAPMRAIIYLSGVAVLLDLIILIF